MGQRTMKTKSDQKARGKRSQRSQRSMLLMRVWKVGHYLLILFFLSLFACVVLFWSFNKISPLKTPNIEISTTVLSEEGDILRQFANSDGIFRQWLTLDEVSPAYLNALIQYEDRYFYHHFGVNPLATLRALGQMILHRDIISGSSTLTMQVARLLYPHERTFAGKLMQMFRAMQLELQYSKAEILTLYINLAPMGGNIEGVGAASERYFSKKASELTLSESALLVALPQRPSIYRPDRNLQFAREARDKVLHRLYDFDEIDEATLITASRDIVRYQPASTPLIAPLIAEKLKSTYPDQHVIQTTIDGDLQKTIEAFVLRESQKFPEHVSAGVLVVNNHTHEIKSYIGSVDMFDHNRAGFVDMVEAVRSPGSTLKPFAYGMALDYGIIHEASLLTDVPRSFEGYTPQNFDREFRGRVPMYRALQLSLNIPVVQVFEHLTPFYFLQKMRVAGIHLQVEEPTLSLVLGGVGTTLYEQVRLFSAFANHGVVYPLSVVITDHEENVVINGQSPEKNSEINYETSDKQNYGRILLSPEANWIITKILRSVNPPKRLNTRGIAWKTGTSYGYRDAWAIGTSPDWTVGIWIGRPDGVPNVGILAGDFAAPMLFDIFGFLPKDQAPFKKPLGIVKETICWPSGRKKAQVPSNECQIQYDIDTINGNVPATLYDAKGEVPHQGWPSLVSNAAIDALKSGVNSRHQPRYGQTSLNNIQNRALTTVNERNTAQHSTIQTSSILHGIKIKTLTHESILFKSGYALDLEAQGTPPFRWYLDGRLLTEPQLETETLTEGIHKLSVQDEKGNSDWIQFEVRSAD